MCVGMCVCVCVCACVRVCVLLVVRVSWFISPRKGSGKVLLVLRQEDGKKKRAGGDGVYKGQVETEQMRAS